MILYYMGEWGGGGLGRGQIVLHILEEPLTSRNKLPRDTLVSICLKNLKSQNGAQVIQIIKMLRMHHLCYLISWLLLMLGERSLYHLGEKKHNILF